LINKNNNLSKKLSILIIVVIVFITGLTGFLGSQLTFDYDFEHFFPQNDPDLEYFLDFRKTYENDNDYILIAIGSDDGVFNVDFLQKATDFSNDLKKLNHVERIISPTHIKQPIFNAFGFIEIPLLHINDSSKYANDRLRIQKSKEYAGTLFSKDLNSICIVVHNTQIITKKASDELLNDIENLIKKYDFDSVHYAGKIRGQKTYLTKMKTELIVFLSISMLLIVLFLTISFKSIFGIIVPIATVFISIVWVLGVMQFTGKSLDVMTTLLPTILFVVGMSDAVHIINKYTEELRNGKPKLEAVKLTFKEVGLATLLTSVTTAVGFITLMMLGIKPIQEFGLYTALGVLIAFIVAITFLPALLSLIKKPKIANKPHHLVFWKRILSEVFLLTMRHPKKIILFSLGFTTLAFIGLFQLKIDYHLLEDLSEKDPLQQDFRFFENQYAGIRPFEMTINIKDKKSSVFDYEVMQEMSKTQDYLQQQYGVGYIFSPVSIVKLLNKALHSGNNNYYKIPSNSETYTKVLKKLNHPSLKKSLKKIVRSDNKQCRFTGKMDDVGSKKANELNANFETYFNKSINTSVIQYKMTGTALLVDKNNEFLAINMITGLGIAFLLIAIVIGLLFRSFKMAIISLIPNFIPLIIIGGIMGYFGHAINMSTSIIFTIAFGIAVDDTIHFLSKFKIEQQKEIPFLYAIKRTYLSTGKAIILTTLILCGGFLSLIFSDFKSTYLIGIYVSITLFIAVITDLFLLPVLLIIFKKKL
jgi:predicted RND superfamily exporter protein